MDPDNDGPAADPEKQRPDGDGQHGKKDKKAPKRKMSKEAKELAKRIDRGPGIKVKKIIDKKMQGKMRHVENLYKESQGRAVKANEWLLPQEAGFLETEGAERSWNVKQRDILPQVASGAARKAFELRLPNLGPYTLDFSRSGRYLLLAGRLGHLAMIDWHKHSLITEIQVKETTRDICFLHNETFFAAAQKKYVYVYDKRGVEVHCLKDHGEPNVLQFLPHHFLLCCASDAGVLRYQDTSTGHIVAEHKPRLGPLTVMRQNPYNAVLGLGHPGGTVTMWTPNMGTPVVKMLCHRGPVKAVAFDTTGHYMVTAGMDSQVKVWDVRTYKPVHAYFSYSPATSLDISQRGLLMVGYGRKVQVWRDALATKANAPYMSHQLYEGDHLSDAQFVPYEDALGLGSSGGFASILVPGAGEPNFDSYVANPYASLKERREGEVAALLDKLQPDTIVLDPTTIGKLAKTPKEVAAEKRAEAAAANAAIKAKQLAKNEAKTKMKGKNRPSRRHKKKQTNIIEEKKPQIKERIKEELQRKREAEKAAAKEARAKKEEAMKGVPRALAKLYGK